MENKKNLNINRGAAILLLLFVLLFILLFARFLYIEIKQEVSGKSLHALAEELWEDKRIIEAQRGPIFDRKGNVLAQNIPAYKIYAIVDETHPNHVKDPKKTASLLAPILGGNEEELVRTLEQKDRFQVEFGAYGRKLTQAQKAEIESLSLPGIGFSHESTRYYPNQVFASHILGFATEDAETETQQGMLGLEKAFNDYLTEQNGSITYKRDASGIKLPVPEERITKPKNGNEIYLTLDEKIQLFVEQALNEVMEQYDPERAMAIVVDPKTGEVVAMGNAPSFNPNKRDVESYVNNPISSRFEPGSTMKIFTLAAAIEEGVYNGQEAFQSGRYQVAGGVISDHNNGQGWGSISFD